MDQKRLPVRIKVRETRRISALPHERKRGARKGISGPSRRLFFTLDPEIKQGIHNGQDRRSPALGLTVSTIEVLGELRTRIQPSGSKVVLVGSTKKGSAPKEYVLQQIFKLWERELLFPSFLFQRLRK